VTLAGAERGTGSDLAGIVLRRLIKSSDVCTSDVETVYKLNITIEVLLYVIIIIIIIIIIYRPSLSRAAQQ